VEGESFLSLPKGVRGSRRSFPEGRKKKKTINRVILGERRETDDRPYLYYAASREEGKRIFFLLLSQEGCTPAKKKKIKRKKKRRANALPGKTGEGRKGKGFSATSEARYPFYLRRFQQRVEGKCPLVPGKKKGKKGKG